MSSRDRARAHLKHAHHCTCGRVVHGNGAKWQHGEMHYRRSDGHRWITQEAAESCSHPDRNGRHEWYVQADRSTLCRACGARIAAVPKPACSLHR